MGEKSSRLRSLLGIDPEISRPDLYQMLGLDRRSFDPSSVEPAFKKRLARLEQLAGKADSRLLEKATGEVVEAISRAPGGPRIAGSDAEPSRPSS